MNRTELTSVVISTIADDGLTGLSVRAVARRAEISIGAVQHYFPTKSAMLTAAMDFISDAAAQQLRRAAELPTPTARIHALLDVLVPGSPDDVAYLVWIAFAAQSAVDPSTRAIYAPLWGRVRTLLATVITAAEPHPPPGAATRYATELLALADGFAVSIVAEPSAISPSTARSILRSRADQILAELAVRT